MEGLVWNPTERRQFPINSLLIAYYIVVKNFFNKETMVNVLQLKSWFNMNIWRYNCYNSFSGAVMIVAGEKETMDFLVCSMIPCVE